MHRLVGCLIVYRILSKTCRSGSIKSRRDYAGLTSLHFPLAFYTLHFTLVDTDKSTGDSCLLPLASCLLARSDRSCQLAFLGQSRTCTVYLYSYPTNRPCVYSAKGQARDVGLGSRVEDGREERSWKDDEANDGVSDDDRKSR